MDYGSTHVFLYNNSDEEVISDTEYNEGMWLSDSDEDTPAPLPKPSQVPKLELSASKYQNLPKDDTSDDEEYADITMPNIPLRGSATGGGAEGGVDKTKKKSVTYAEIDVTKSSSPPKKNEKSLGSKLRANYVKIGQNTTVPLPPAPPAPPLVTPRAVKSASVSAPAAAPKKGIIKSRIAPELSKMKRQRVKWQQAPTNGRGSTFLERQANRRARRADTNILAVKFNTLTGPSAVHTGDSVVCSNPSCTAILSHLSRLSDPRGEDDSREWVCEFCGSSTEVDIVEEEKPSKSDTTYLITPAVVEGGGAMGGALGSDDAMVIFCIDISGSMCVTTEVPGKFELKGHERLRSLSSLNVERQNQYLPGQRRNVTYVSRLQAVQAAVDHQIQSLNTSHPHHRVALITFSDEVTVLGDGRGEVVTVAGDKLFDSDNLVKSGSEAPLPLPVKDTHTSLSAKVFGLEEGGQTALGPALLLAVSMASRAPGSKVIICTDGLANKGVGNLDDLATDEEQADAQTFYEDLGILAQEKNVTVSLVSIKGSDCRIVELGQVADKTGGQVTVVDPLNITKEFSTILANPVIATDVITKIILHKDLYFRTEESMESVLVIPVGSVTAQTELTYDYGVRKKRKTATETEDKDQQKSGTGATDSGTSPSGDASVKADDKAASGGGSSVTGGATAGATGGASGGVTGGASGGATAGASGASEVADVAPLMVDGKPHLPFQLQIKYTAQDGSRCMRVITQAKPITTERNVAEKDIDMSVVGAHVAHTTATLAMGGEYSQARLSAFSNQRMLQRNSHVSPHNRVMYNNLMEDLIPLENRLRDHQLSEQQRYGRAHSDDEEEEEVHYNPTSRLMAARKTAGTQKTRSEPGRFSGLFGAKKKKKAISRRKEVSDDLATYCYQMKSSTSTAYSQVDAADEDTEDEEDQ